MKMFLLLLLFSIYQLTHLTGQNNSLTQIDGTLRTGLPGQNNVLLSFNSTSSWNFSEYGVVPNSALRLSNLGSKDFLIDIEGNVGIDDNSPNHRLSLGSSLATTKLALYEASDNSSNYGMGVVAGQFRLNIGNPQARYAFFDQPGESANEILTLNGNGKLGIKDVDPEHELSLGSSLNRTKLALWESNDNTKNYGLGVTSNTFNFNISNTDANYVFWDGDGQNANKLIEIKGTGEIFAYDLDFIGDQSNMQYDPTTGEIGYDNSSRRYKTNITTLLDDWSKIMHVRPVKYTRKRSPEHWEYGYIAEEMDSIGLTNLVGYDAQGLPNDVKYDRMVLYLTEVVKKQAKDISTLENKLNALVSRSQETASNQ